MGQKRSNAALNNLNMYISNTTITTRKILLSSLSFFLPLLFRRTEYEVGLPYTATFVFGIYFAANAERPYS
jgi:hypothetical protein